MAATTDDTYSQASATMFKTALRKALIERDYFRKLEVERDATIEQMIANDTLYYTLLETLPVGGGAQFRPSGYGLYFLGQLPENTVNPEYTLLDKETQKVVHGMYSLTTHPRLMQRSGLQLLHPNRTNDSDVAAAYFTSTYNDRIPATYAMSREEDAFGNLTYPYGDVDATMTFSRLAKTFLPASSWKEGGVLEWERISTQVAGYYEVYHLLYSNYVEADLFEFPTPINYTLLTEIKWEDRFGGACDPHVEVHHLHMVFSFLGSFVKVLARNTTSMKKL